MKRLLIVVSLFVLLFHGAQATIHVEAKEIHERKSSCANVDEEMKKNIIQLAEIFIQNDLENLKTD